MPGRKRGHHYVTGIYKKSKERTHSKKNAVAGSEGRSLSKTPKTAKNWCCQQLSDSIGTAAPQTVRVC